MTDSAAVRRLIIAASIGNTLEWFDLGVFGFFALAIGQAMFPHAAQDIDQARQVLAGPITPPPYGELIVASLSNSRLVRVYAGSHNTDSAWMQCLGPMVRRFIGNPAPAELDDRCAERVASPSFVIN